MSSASPVSLKQLYQEECAAVKCRVNTGVLKLLPDRPEDAGVLHEIDLSTNIVGQNGLHSVLVVAQHAPALRRLILRDNYLTNDNIKELASRLDGHPSLSLIDLSSNPISHAGGKTLSAFARRNPRIQGILLKGTLINVALIGIIEKKCQEHEAIDKAAGEGDTAGAANGDTASSEGKPAAATPTQEPAAVAPSEPSKKEENQMPSEAFHVVTPAPPSQMKPEYSAPSRHDTQGSEDTSRGNQKRLASLGLLADAVGGEQKKFKGLAALLAAGNAHQVRKPVSSSTSTEARKSSSPAVCLPYPHLDVLGAAILGEDATQYDGLRTLLMATVPKEISIHTAAPKMAIDGTHEPVQRQELRSLRLLNTVLDSSNVETIALRYLMVSGGISPRSSRVSSPNTFGSRDDDNALGATISGAEHLTAGAHVPRNALRCLRYLLPESELAGLGVQCLLLSAFGNSHKVFPRLELMRTILPEYEAAGGYAPAVAILLATAFGEKIENISPVRRRSPHKAQSNPPQKGEESLRSEQGPRRIVSFTGAPKASSPSNSPLLPPLARRKYLPLYVLNQAIPEGDSHGPLKLLMEAVMNAPMAVLQEASPTFTEANQGLLARIASKPKLDSAEGSVNSKKSPRGISFAGNEQQVDMVTTTSGSGGNTPLIPNDGEKEKVMKNTLSMSDTSLKETEASGEMTKTNSSNNLGDSGVTSPSERLREPVPWTALSSVFDAADDNGKQFAALAELRNVANAAQARSNSRRRH